MRHWMWLLVLAFVLAVAPAKGAPAGECPPLPDTSNAREGWRGLVKYVVDLDGDGKPNFRILQWLRIGHIIREGKEVGLVNERIGRYYEGDQDTPEFQIDVLDRYYFNDDARQGARLNFQVTVCGPGIKEVSAFEIRGDPKKPLDEVRKELFAIDSPIGQLFVSWLQKMGAAADQALSFIPAVEVTFKSDPQAYRYSWDVRLVYGPKGLISQALE